MSSIDSTVSVFVDSMLAIAGAERAFVLLVEKGKLRYRIGRDRHGKSIPMDSDHVNRNIIRQSMQGKRTTRAGDGRVVLALCLPVIDEDGKALGAVYLDSRSALPALVGRSISVLENLCREIAGAANQPAPRAPQATQAPAPAGARRASIVDMVAILETLTSAKDGLELALANVSLEIFDAETVFVMLLHHGEFSFACGRNRQGDDVPEVDFLEVRQLAMASLAEMETRSESVHFPPPYGTLVSICCPMLIDKELVGLVGLSRKAAMSEVEQQQLERLANLAGKLLTGGPREGAGSVLGNAEAAIERDREIAVELRENLTGPPPALRGVDVFCETSYADGCGGDAHGYEPDPHNQGATFIWLAEATRGGYMGAIDLTTVRTLLRTVLNVCGPLPLSEVVAKLNGLLLEDSRGGAPTALVLIHVDPPSSSLQFVSAGIPSVWRCAPDTGPVPIIEAGQLGPIGEKPLDEVPSFAETLQPDEFWVFSLAGLVATTNGDDEAYGYDRLQEALSGMSQLSSEEISAQLFKAVEAFHGARPLPFDTTVCVVRKTL